LLGLKEQSQTILLITHKAPYASLADHLYEVQGGRVTSASRTPPQAL